VGVQRYPLFGRLGFDDRRAQHQIGHHHWRAFVVEGEHIGGVVLAAVVAVQRTAFIGTHDAHRDLPRCGQRRTHPARHAVSRQQRAVTRVGELQRQLQWWQSGRLHALLHLWLCVRLRSGSAAS